MTRYAIFRLLRQFKQANVSFGAYLELFSNPLLLFGRDFEMNTDIAEPASFYLGIIQENLKMIDPDNCLPIIHCLGRLLSIWNVEGQFHLSAFSILGHLTKKICSKPSSMQPNLIHSILLVIERYVEKLDSRVHRV